MKKTYNVDDHLTSFGIRKPTKEFPQTDFPRQTQEDIIWSTGTHDGEKNRKPTEGYRRMEIENKEHIYKTLMIMLQISFESLSSKNSRPIFHAGTYSFIIDSCKYYFQSTYTFTCTRGRESAKNSIFNSNISFVQQQYLDFKLEENTSRKV